MTTSGTTEDHCHVEHLRDRVPTIARECGWPSYHPMINALMNDPTVLSGYDEQSLRRLLDPHSTENVCKTDGRLLILTPHKRSYGPTPIDVANRHLPDNWIDGCNSIVGESTALVFLGADSEIVRFDGAGCGNRTLLDTAHYLSVYYLVRAEEPCYEIVLTLEKMMHTAPQDGHHLRYRTVRFDRSDSEWRKVTLWRRLAL